MTTNTNTQTIETRRTATQALVINGLFIALTLAATMFINVRLPFMGSGGLIHLGNVPLFIGAIVYGKKTGCIAGALGMGMFDLISGWTAWAPFTCIIVGAMGYAVGFIAEKVQMKPMIVNTIAIVVALMIKLVGYYFAEVILYGNWILPFGSILGNVMQVIVAGIVVLPIAERLKKLAR